MEELDAVHHGETDFEDGNATEQHVTLEGHGPVRSYAFPLHEEPVELEKTCAICLDDFGKYFCSIVHM